MNVLVTGGAGYIGSHACKQLALSGHRCVTFDNLSRGHDWAVQWGPLVQGDLADTELLRRTFHENKIDAVMHFAAWTYVGESMQKPEMYFDNNFKGSFSLLEAMRAEGVKTIIFSSTAASYGDPIHVPIEESHPQSPVNPYGESKLMVEKALKWYGQIHGFQWSALRYFNASGCDADAETGELHDPETHLIPLVLEAVLNPDKPIRIFGTDYPTADGTAVRDYIHVTDLAEAHVRALEYLKNGGPSRAFNLGTGSGYSVRQVVDTVTAVTGKAPAVVEAPRRAGDPPDLVANSSAAQATFEWTPTRSSLENIIQTAWRWRTTAPYFSK